MGCCDCMRNKTNTREQEEEDNKIIYDLNSSRFNPNSTKENFDSGIDEIKPEDSYFRRPVNNKYTTNELFSMDVEELILGVHPTLYKKDKKDSKYHKSFHPFFYLKLYNEDIENFGVIVQYLKVPEDVREDQHHLYEENGIEFIEKNFDRFEIEFKTIFYKVENLNIYNIYDFIIRFSSSQFDRMNLGDFFLRAIPERGIWLQDKLKGLKKTCFDFCKNTIENLNVRKKKKDSIKKIKDNLAQIIKRAENEKYYDKYVEGFEALFNAISE